MSVPTTILQAPFRPDPIPEIQETYLSSLEVQVLATLVLVACCLLAVEGVSHLESRLQERYGPDISEASAVVGLGGIVAAGVYAFTVIWQVTYVLYWMIQTIAFDRWTAALSLVTAAIVVTAYLAIRFVNRSIDKLADTEAITKHQSEAAYHVGDVGIVVAAGTLILTLWGVDLTNIFIGAGAITAVVALTARETLTSMLAGFILLFSRPFRVGDWIEVNEAAGIVTDVTVFNTKIQTFDDKHVLVPNDEITSSHLTNYSRNDQLRLEIEVGVDYDTDLERAREVALEAVSELESIKDTPNPQVVAKHFGDSAIVLECQVWIADPTKRRTWNARTDVIEAITTAFGRAGIEIPYPHRVHAPRDEEGYPIRTTVPDGVDVPSAQD